MTCNDLNSHPRDSRLSFDPDAHSYFVDGEEYISVTALVDDYFPKFDSRYWAARAAIREGVDPEVILDRWEREGERSRSLGTAMHEKIERFYLGFDDGDDKDAMRLFRLFAAHNRLYPFRTEWRIFDEDYGVAGTLDFIERTPQGSYNIYDWKRSKKLVRSDGRIMSESPFGKRGLYPVSHLHDTPYWHYALQLSIYRSILERSYGIRVSSLLLGVFHPDCSTPWIVRVPYLKDEVEAIVRHSRSAVVKHC